MRRILTGILATWAAVAEAHAADVDQTGVSPRAAQTTRSSAFLSEMRLGATAQDPGGPESGSANLTAEVLSLRPLTAVDPVLNLLIPRVHLGGSLNLNGQTSFAYVGLTWTFDVTSNVFVEGSFGGAVHNGKTDPAVLHRSALGCTALFRESGTLGVRLTQDWSVMATVEHLSNAGLCSNNRGLTNVGVRVGYTF
ncbi:acyloxyacyl hydrolase [Microvirga alba]|uniref:Acyloxyacyl hydrolase n=1 Tax=Microvirga alba TaxID=2791025 RepID=A0A931BV36_9HYPH|nr:acyloxyacyl hydrolase [Microvirga alba]MBF9235278.1 acyloxyacyl hydrolase [Microvirga alba]